MMRAMRAIEELSLVGERMAHEHHARHVVPSRDALPLHARREAARWLRADVSDDEVLAILRSYDAELEALVFED